MVNVPISGDCECFFNDDDNVRREKCNVSVNHSLPPVINPIQVNKKKVCVGREKKGMNE